MDLKKRIFEGLEETSRRSEKNLVVDFVSDRFAHFVGVYLLVLLAILSKIGQVIGSGLHCYDATDDGFDKTTFYKYAEKYCWYSERVTSPNKSEVAATCAALVENRKLDGLHLPTNPQHVKSFVQWLPYALLIQAFLLCLPSVYWNFRVGSRLQGHLLFLQNLQKDIYEDIKCIPSGIHSSAKMLPENQQERKVNDRLMMSLLCQENLASFEHHLFLTSVYELMPNHNGKFWPLKAVVMKQWCQEDGNLASDRKPVLIQCYKIKQFLAILVCFVCISAHLIVMCFVLSDGWGENIFPCDIPRFETRCVICTFPSILESFAILISAGIASCLYMTITIRALWTFQTQKNFLIADFFDQAAAEGSFSSLIAATRMAAPAKQ